MLIPIDVIAIYVETDKRIIFTTDTTNEIVSVCEVVKKSLGLSTKPQAPPKHLKYNIVCMIACGTDSNNTSTKIRSVSY